MSVDNNIQSTGLSNREPILSVRDTSVTFDMDRGESRVLDNVNIDINQEEILGIVGESGSGKSMFASALLDAVVDPGNLNGQITYHTDDGESVDILGLNKNELKQLRWEEISMVFQGALSSFNPTLDVRSHFEETIRSHDYNIEEGMKQARELLSDLYLDPERVFNSYPHELSGGMKQRALIALSLVLQPNVLVMDEPTAALDLLMQRSILGLLENLQKKYDLTVVFITHDLPLVAGLADRLAVLYAFEFVEIGPADQILKQPSHPYTRALLKAVPNLNTSLKEMKPIEGSSPDPVAVPEGCSYHPRCPLATDECLETDPSFDEVGDEHRAACFHWEEAIEEIPFSFETSDEVDDVGEDQSSLSTDDGPVDADSSDTRILSLNDLEVAFEESQGLLEFFEEPDTVRAVDGIDLDIYDNDVIALVGESGCGKTTLGKAAIGVQRPTDGEVRFRGQNIWEAGDTTREGQLSDEEIRRSLQIVHQDPGGALNPNRTVEASLAVPLKRWHPNLSYEDRRQRIYTMLELVGMQPPEDYASRYPHQLSGGEQQRVALIAALLMNPDLIFADESVSALDVSLRIEMMDLMLELQDTFDTSYLFISHDLSNARYFAGNADGRIGVMYLGEIIEIGPAEEIINNPQHPYTKVLIWSTADLEMDDDVSEPPIRSIDIPDPIDPPEGCRFHTRCPVAREVCTNQSPQLDAKQDDAHQTSCFREYDQKHEYWNSEPLEGASYDY